MHLCWNNKLGNWWSTLPAACRHPSLNLPLEWVPFSFDQKNKIMTNNPEGILQKAFLLSKCLPLSTKNPFKDLDICIMLYTQPPTSSISTCSYPDYLNVPVWRHSSKSQTGTLHNCQNSEHTLIHSIITLFRILLTVVHDNQARRLSCNWK